MEEGLEWGGGWEESCICPNLADAFQLIFIFRLTTKTGTSRVMFVCSSDVE